MSKITGIPRKRLATHGDFEQSAKLSQRLKDVLMEHWGWSKLSPAQREALQMDCFKTARIMCGDPDHEDHWVDKAGYSQLGRVACKRKGKRDVRS